MNIRKNWKASILRQRLESAQWHFFAYTRVGDFICRKMTELSQRHPDSKICAWLRNATLPF